MDLFLVACIPALLVFFGLELGYLRAIKAARYQAACDAVEQVSAQLADHGLTNGWVVCQAKKGGTITVLPYAGDGVETTAIRTIKPGTN
jgi:hypothetical protein